MNVINWSAWHHVLLVLEEYLQWYGVELECPVSICLLLADSA